MGFGFRVGVPGLSVRVSTRGVRASVGPRIARVHMGSGRTSVSSGLGPFFASTSLGGGGRGTTRRRSSGPSAAQLERARRAAERAQQEAERDALIAQLKELRRQTTSVHLQDFPPARLPIVSRPPALDQDWALSAASAFHLRGLGVFARADRAAARRRARQEAPAYLASERARLAQKHQQLAASADQWWQALTMNDEETVCEAVNAAFADNPAAGCAVGVRDGVLSVLMRQQDLDTLPDRMPALTPGGRTTLKKLTKRDRLLWWLTIMGSNVIATLKEAFASAPGITAIDLAVLTRMSETQRLGVVAYGQWTRRAIETTPWREPRDALHFLDLGRDVSCSVTVTASGNLSTVVKPLDIERLPSLRELLETALDEGEQSLDDFGDVLEPASPLINPYETVPFAQWRQSAAPSPLPPSPVHLAPGQHLPLPEATVRDLTAAFGSLDPDADLVLLLTGADGRVGGDEDFVFYNQPIAAQGAVRLLGKSSEETYSVQRAALDLAALPPHLHRVILAIGMGRPAEGAGLQLHSIAGCWVLPVPPDPAARAVVIAELYRSADGGSAWHLRSVGQGWPGGLADLARAHGVVIT
ncbi:hypothetical protein GCM10009550_35230 [Actinocorallia libanotica]|uniref:TerD domain-containing protein n=2 Tax=Actinocorallia libanotica TaxID=46162 RepID=A0ABP4BRJ5_9ACTN